MRRKCIRSFIVALLSALAVFISVLGNTGVKIVYAEENKAYEWVKVDTVYHIADDYIGKSGNYGEYYYYSYGYDTGVVNPAGNNAVRLTQVGGWDPGKQSGGKLGTGTVCAECSVAPERVGAGENLWLDVNLYFDKYDPGSNDVKGYCWVYSDMLGDTRDDGNYFYEEKGSKYNCTVSHHRSNSVNKLSDSMKVRQEMKKQSSSIKVGDRVGVYFAMMGGGTAEYGISYVEWIYELREMVTASESQVQQTESTNTGEYEWVKVDTKVHIADAYVGKSGNYGEHYYYDYDYDLKAVSPSEQYVVRLIQTGGWDSGNQPGGESGTGTVYAECSVAPAKVAAGGKLWLDVNMYFDKYNLGSNDVKGYCWVYSDMLGDTRDDGNIFYEEKGSKYACTVSHHRTNEYNRISDSMKVRQEMKKQSFSIKVGDRVGIYFAMMGGGTGEYGISYVEWIYELREVGTTP